MEIAHEPEGACVRKPTRVKEPGIGSDNPENTMIFPPPALPVSVRGFAYHEYQAGPDMQGKCYCKEQITGIPEPHEGITRQL